MNGWFVTAHKPEGLLWADGQADVSHGQRGEVTGFDGTSIFVVFDGEQDPHAMPWHKVRPA